MSGGGGDGEGVGRKSGNGGLDNNQVESGKTVVGVVAEAKAEVGEN